MAKDKAPSERELASQTTEGACGQYNLPQRIDRFEHDGLPPSRFACHLPPGGRLNLTRAPFCQLCFLVNHGYARREQAPALQISKKLRKGAYNHWSALTYTRRKPYFTADRLFHIFRKENISHGVSRISLCAARHAPAGQGKAYPCIKISSESSV